MAEPQYQTRTPWTSGQPGTSQQLTRQIIPGCCIEKQKSTDFEEIGGQVNRLKLILSSLEKATELHPSEPLKHGDRASAELRATQDGGFIFKQNRSRNPQHHS
ncbi:hypothetical protein STEG23_013758 [Scotinomys teguina]